MFDDFRAYYEENVVAAYVEYSTTAGERVSGRSRDTRRALAAAGALFHLREHVPKPHRLSRSQVEALCPDYGILGDVSNAAKHREISQLTPHGPPLINDAGQICEENFIVEYFDTEGSYRHVQKVVVVRMASGTERYLSELLANVMNFWEGHLASLGLIGSARKFSCPDEIGFRSRSECAGARLDLEIVKGQRLKQTFRLMRFDSVKGNAVPVDLSGFKACASFYEPPTYKVDLTLTHDKSGQELKCTVTLSDDEADSLLGLPDEIEVQRVLRHLPSVRDALQKLVRQGSGASSSKGSGAVVDNDGGE